MQLYGRLQDLTGTRLEFADDLKLNLDQADAVAESIKNTIDKFIESAGIKHPGGRTISPRLGTYQPSFGVGLYRRQLSQLSFGRSVIELITVGLRFRFSMGKGIPHINEA